ncbi:discoidin domain-containing protein [Methylorubrum populi]|jgi:hypothetical protein|uniref:discoidin domain-containing protein n=1 Tax=Methylorubrum populi TaxID=223967 RepID=UPI000A52C04C|nr:discoidin domain-containing protein [Methylorubrum populi]
MSPQDSRISSLFQKVGDAFHVAAPYVFFGGMNNRHLHIAKRLRARYIRLALSGVTCLHLHRITISDESGPLELGCESITASSYYAADERSECDRLDIITERARSLIGHGDHDGLHTNIEIDPYIIVDLKEIRELFGIKIENRGDYYACRNWGLVLYTSLDGTSWDKAYDHRITSRNVFDVFLHGAENTTDQVFASFIKFYIEIASCFFESGEIQTDNVINHCDRNGWSIKTVFSEINRHLLQNFGRSIGAHGFKRNFEYWLEEEKATYLKECLVIIEALKPKIVDACLGYGAVLSYVRDGQLISHDDDIDIIVSVDRSDCSSLNSAIDAVQYHLRGKDILAFGDFFGHRKVQTSSGNIVDIFIGLREGEFVSFFPGPRKVIRHESIFPPLHGLLHGVRVPLPRDCLTYLGKVYGTAWRQPDPGFSHDWSGRGFEDIIFSFADLPPDEL